MTRRLELSERDEALLRAVGDLRLVSGQQLRRLLFAGPGASSQNDRIARRALQRLVNHGLLWRDERRVGGLRAGSSSHVFALSAPGARALGLTRRGQERSPSLQFRDHSLAVAEVFVRLHEARYAGRLEALQASTEPTCWRPLEDGTGSSLKPDLFVTASTATEDHLAFIEVDLGSEHPAALRRKAALYRAHFASGREQAEQGVFPLVLWQATAPDRRQALAGVLADYEPFHRVVDPDELVNQLTKGGH